MAKISSTVLSAMADELVEQAVLTFDVDEVVFEETKRGLEVIDKYHELWSIVYGILDNNLNGDK